MEALIIVTLISRLFIGQQIYEFHISSYEPVVLLIYTTGTNHCFIFSR